MIPLDVSSPGILAGIFYTQTAGIYTFCFKVYICNKLICFVPRIYCYSLTVFPCSPYCLVCDGICEDSGLCNCTACESINYYVANCRCCPKTCHCCDKFGTCDPCLLGHELDSLSKICCPMNCLNCIEGICLACLPNFSSILIDGHVHCLRTNYCLSAELNDAGPMCIICQNEFYLAPDNVCCPLNCKTCDSNGKCILCLPGYTNATSKCV